MTEKFRIAAEIAAAPLPWGASRTMVDPEFDRGPESRRAGGVLRSRCRRMRSTGTPQQEEVIYVVDGRVEQWVDRETRELGPGDMAFIPAGVVHASYNVGDGVAKILAIFGPSVGTGFTTEEVAHEAPWNSLRG